MDLVHFFHLEPTHFSLITQRNRWAHAAECQDLANSNVVSQPMISALQHPMVKGFFGQETRKWVRVGDCRLIYLPCTLLFKVYVAISRFTEDM
jgi:hypothetical protein